jgi:P4 family phage/plasmid primase-like protien
MTNTNEILKKQEEKTKALKVINKKMGNSRGAQDLAETIKIKMRKQTINETMNNNWNLFVFNNKVYDLKQAEFVEPRRDQYMTLSTGYKYEEPEQSDIDKVKQFLQEVIEKKTEREFYLKLLSTALEGRKSNHFIISNGEGGNGKSILHECLGNALGNYSYNIDNSIFQKGGKKDEQSKANIQLKRFVKCVEPNRDVPLDSSLVKELTGNDILTARHLYSAKSENVNHGTYLMECNNKPKFDEATDALERRLIDFRFKVIFKDDIEKYKDIKSVKQADRFYDSPDFKNKMKCAWFYVLAEIHRKHMNNDFKLKIPKEVRERTKKYLEGCGELNSWLNDHLQKTKDETAVLPVMKIYNKLKDSDFWKDLPKKQRREFTYKAIRETIQGHFLWRLSYYERKKINGINHKNILQGYQFVEEQASDEDKDDNEEEDEEDEDEEDVEDKQQDESDDQPEEQPTNDQQQQSSNEEENDDDSDSDDDDMFNAKHTF